MMKLFTILSVLASLILALTLAVGCSSAPTEPTANIITFNYIDYDGNNATLTFDLGNRTLATPNFPAFTYAQLRDWNAYQIVKALPPKTGCVSPVAGMSCECWMYNQFRVAMDAISDAQIDQLSWIISVQYGYQPFIPPSLCN